MLKIIQLIVVLYVKLIFNFSEHTILIFSFKLVDWACTEVCFCFAAAKQEETALYGVPTV